MNRRALLSELLTAYSPDDAVESEYRQRMLDLVDSDGDPFSRSRFDPGHFTVSAFVLAPDRSSLLMIFHAKLERWLQPGGHVEPSDTCLHTAARREVVEETGLTESGTRGRPRGTLRPRHPRDPAEPRSSRLTCTTTCAFCSRRGRCPLHGPQIRTMCAGSNWTRP